MRLYNNQGAYAIFTFDMNGDSLERQVPIELHFTLSAWYFQRQILKGGVRRNYLQRGGRVQPLTREQFVFQINKVFSKRGRGRGALDLPLFSVYKVDTV